MRKRQFWIWGMGLLCGLNAAAQSEPAAIPAVNQQIVHLTVQASQDVPQDLLRLTLSAVREGAQAAEVQAQLKASLEDALAQARRHAKPGAVHVHTGRFSLMPRRNREGRVQGWQGSAELILEGRDIMTLSELAGRLQTLSITQSQFSVSREAQEALETSLQAQAIDRFKARANEVAKSFGFSSVVLREVTLSSTEALPASPRLMARAAVADTDAPLPLEAGMGTVRVTVNGSVQLR